ncbi:MAG TPA: hypothetical protein VGQ00_02275 [Candidatus Norongarragalinales archaeon]|jgi:hypothetical protein|nr:hypothetical protein [Candidatus Norongarragalinales archaeon]
MPNDQELADLIAKIRSAVQDDDRVALKALASETAELVLLRNDSSLMPIAIVAHSVAKFLEKPYIASAAEWPMYKTKISQHLTNASNALERNDVQAFQKTMSQAARDIDDVSTALGRFVRSYAEKARIKTGADMYAHGASLGTAVQLAGVDKRDLSEYIGATTLHEKYQTIPLARRLQITEELFE